MRNEYMDGSSRWSIARRAIIASNQYFGQFCRSRREVVFMDTNCRFREHCSAVRATVSNEKIGERLLEPYAF